MVYCSRLGKIVQPNLEVAESIVRSLNSDFDSYEMWHHASGHNSTEMFEFNYSLDSDRREKWSIDFLGKCVACGGVFCADYEDFYEEDYTFMSEENHDIIYKNAYNNALELIVNRIELFANSNISSDIKREWIKAIEKGIDRVGTNDDNLF